MDTEPLEDDDVEASSLDHFLHEGLITDVVRIVKTGKEASVHLCRGNRSTTGEDLVALKVYHPLDRRDFRDESIYRDGEWIEERRIRAALREEDAVRPPGPGRPLGQPRVGDAPSALGGGVARPAADRVDRRRDPDELRRRPRPRSAAAPFDQTGSRRGSGPVRTGPARDRADAVRQRDPRRPVRLQPARVGRSRGRHRPPAGDRPAQEPPRPGAARARRAADLRALRTVRGAIGAGPARRGPVDGVGVRRPRAGGAPDGSSRL